MTAAVTKPGFYELPAELYHADPAPAPSFNAGTGAALVTGTMRDAYWGHPRLNPDWELKDDRKYDLGSVAHALVLGAGRDLVVIDAEDWRKSEAKARRAEAVEAGKQPCLVGVHDKALAMRTALHEQLAGDAENSRAFDPAYGVGESCAFWQEETAHGLVWCRSMMDWRERDAPVIYDYKTFDGEQGADPEAFVKHLVGQGKDVQDPHYSAGMAALLGVPVEDVVFRFVVQCPQPPYLAAVVELKPATKAWSRQRRSWALERFARGLAAGRWPGHAPRTHHVDAPGWAEMRWEERLMAAEMLEEIERREAAA